jgi:hypothetical protein
MKHFCLELKRFSRGKIFERGRPQQYVISLKTNMLADKNILLLDLIVELKYENVFVI